MVAHAQTILSWQENCLDEHDMPPEWMWPFDDELEEWFEEVNRRRKARWGRGNDDADEELDGPVMENELAKGLR